ncbi:hypothetical protein [Flavobacterium johnsoniae]|uniref:Uncharacterized protein n=1 Tax=Flavobacterium johnsoniae TaxID=986 RepID=A0A1M5VJN0_FLAJO|nr:hypothetical protein [Flavobacterium johnsoniae]SHH75398.1 hypothetical protein SAMN05444388_11816 [Flavobacterium johnsoniae]
MANLNTIKNWFKTGLKPTQQQFWDTWDSFFHKDELIPQSSVSNLITVLNAKAEKSQFDAHKIDANAHGDLFNSKEDKFNKGMPGGYVPLNEVGKIVSNYLQMINDLTTGGQNPLTAEQGKILQTQIDSINVILSSDDLDLDTIQEIVDKIKEFQDGVDIILVNDLTTGGATKALSAEMGKALNLAKESLSNKTLSLSALSTDEEYPSAKTVYDFVSQYVKPSDNLNVTQIINLVENNSLIPGNYYLVNDFQTIYKINGSDSTPPTYLREILSVVSNYAVLDVGYEFLLDVGKVVTITKLPAGYSGALAVGQTTTVSQISSNYYFRFANGMQGVMGLEFSFTTPKYSNGIADNIIVNDLNGKPVIKPGGVLNTEVHDNTPYMNMTAAENLGVPVEAIILKAKSTNEFEIEGKSVTYVDDIIEYQLPVPGSAAVKGTILRRYNNRLNIDVRDDWRVKRYRRWKIDSDSILKVLNQDQPVTSLTGNNGVYQFTARQTSSSTPDMFYIADDLDSKSLAIDEFTKVKDFTLAVSSQTDAKDYPIFSLDEDHKPIRVTKFKVSGLFSNAIIQKNDGDLNFDTNVDAEELTNSTFVCSMSIAGRFVKIRNSLFLDSMSIVTNIESLMNIDNLKCLSFFQCEQPLGLNIFNSVIGINTNNYSGAPFPSVRWCTFMAPVNSTIENSLIGGSIMTWIFHNTHILNSTVYIYMNTSSDANSAEVEHKLIFDNCFFKYFTLLHRARLSSSIFENILCNPEYTPANTAQRDLYVNSTDTSQIVIKYNKYSRKLYFEDRNISDELTINTFALPA